MLFFWISQASTQLIVTFNQLEIIVFPVLSIFPEFPCIKYDFDQNVKTSMLIILQDKFGLYLKWKNPKS